MMRKSWIWLIVTVIFAIVPDALAQQPKKAPRLGLLSGARAQPLPPAIEAFIQGLRELGYVDGQNIEIEYRWADAKDDRYPILAAELVRAGVDVLVAQGTRAAVAAKQATKTTPIVVGGAGDLVGEGLVDSLARPGGNLTGFTNIDPDLSAKRLQLLKEALPRVSRVAVLYQGGPGGDHEELKETQSAAQTMGLLILPFQVADPSKFQGTFAAVIKERANAMIVFHNIFTSYHRKQFLGFAMKNRLPAMYGNSDWITDGGLISYGHDRRHQWRRAAHFVVKILKGAKPADLPVEQPSKFELIININTAKQIGVTIPQSVLFRADRVIRD